jgi:hypothetical protein
MRRDFRAHDDSAQLVAMELKLDISDDALERLADLVAERLRREVTADARIELIDAGEVAARLGRSREWVYDNAADLGAVRLGSRLSFEWPSCWERLKAAQDENARTASEGSRHVPAPVTTGRNPPRRNAPTGTRRDLLPVRGSQSA